MEWLTLFFLHVIWSQILKTMKTLTKVTDSVLTQLKEEMVLRKTSEVFLLFSFGSQFSHLIAQMMARIGVFCLEADPAKITANDVGQINPIGIVLSGGPHSVVDDPPPFDLGILGIGIPVFGICLGFQVIAKYVGASVIHGALRELHTYQLRKLDGAAALLKGCTENHQVLQSHGDMIETNAVSLVVTASTENAPVAAGESGHLHGVQFHPEVPDTTCGELIFTNFCFGICGAKDRFPSKDVAEQKVRELVKELKGKTVLLALSGGTDSSIVAYLLKKAREFYPFDIIGIYIKGLDRSKDEQSVRHFFEGQPWLTFEVIDATRDFLSELQGQKTSALKRKAMKRVYQKVLQGAVDHYKADCIVQGTLNTDVTESGGGMVTGARTATIKEHHNVGLSFFVPGSNSEKPLPEITPLVDQVKDTGRNIGQEIGVPVELLWRHPFPGPGLSIRISDEVTFEKLRISRQVHEILDEELAKAGHDKAVWQYGAYVTNEQHTCSKGDEAVSGLILMWWAVTSVNGFTAEPADLPYKFRRRVAQRLETEIRGIGAVCYRDSGKPGATIEVG